MTMVGNSVRGYARKVQLFQDNARLYLLYLAISGVAFGVYALLFNFYILSLGYDETLLGRLLSVNSTAALIGTLPAGAVSDRLGRKRALLISGLVTALAIAGLVIWPSTFGLFVMSVFMGLAQSLAAVTLPPFLMENSGEEERTYLFSFSFSLQMLIGMVGFWLGGQLPDWLGGSNAYSEVMVGVAATAVLALAPLLFLRKTNGVGTAVTNTLSPMHYARQHPMLLGKFITPVLITALGAGLFVPFMNVFFRNQYRINDAVIGSLFATGSLAMGLGFLLAPPLADRYGKIRLVILTQVLFIPVLVLLGFAPWFWLSAAAYLVRVVLMTMDDPIYQAFVMEAAAQEARATVASLLTMASSFGWAVGPTISGWLQVTYGFSPVFLIVVGLYVIAVVLTWRFFGKQARSVQFSGSMPAD